MNTKFNPSIVGFFCNWCTYLAADLAGTSRMKYAPNVRVVRTMCSGRVDPQMVLWAFRNGADGVLIGGCHPGDCHYQEGNYKALRRTRLLRKMLPQFGIEPERLRLEWISASEGERLRDVVNEFTEQIRRLGPLPCGAGEGRGDCRVTISACSGGLRPPPRPGAQRAPLQSKGRSQGTMAKPKVAFYWCASCGGCEEAVVDLAEGHPEGRGGRGHRLLAGGARLQALRCRGDGRTAKSPSLSSTARFASSEQEAMAKLLRRKSGLVIAYGACAYLGGHSRPRQPDGQGGDPGITSTTSRPRQPTAPACARRRTSRFPRANWSCRSSTRPSRRSIRSSTSTTTFPAARLRRRSRLQAIEAILSGKLPEKGSVLAGDRALCYECDLNSTKPEKLLVTELKRPHQVLDRPREMPAGAGDSLPGPRHARRLRGAVRQGRHALHRLLRAARTRARLRRQGAFGHRLHRGFHRRDRSSPRFSKPSPIRRGRSIGTACRHRCWPESAKLHRGASWLRESRLIPSPGWKATARSRSFSTTAGKVSRAYFQVPELRGFEQFVVGRPAEEMPQITSRICGVCPTAHHMASHQGAGRSLPGRSAARRQEAAGDDLQHLHARRPRAALLLPGRAGFRRRAQGPQGRAQHPGRARQGRRGSGQAGHRHAQRIARPDQPAWAAR